jgi:delta 1-pyrroline-5-carboxylate dehydrogenase
MAIMREETFGPVVPIVSFTSEDEAVARANASPFGLCASVWSRDVKRAQALLDRIECGVAFVNNCCFTGPMGGAAWSGRKESGSGVTGSRFALESVVRPRTVCIDRSRAKREMWWYPYGDSLVTMARGLVELTRGGGAKVSGAKMAVSGLLNRWKA